jgi:flagellar basal-body rod protein FlgF
MSNPIYALLSSQATLRQQVDILANNVANLSTAGFKREGLVFSTLVERLDVPGRTLSLAELRSTYTDLEAGALQRTGNDLDLAINGHGFFAVETPAGARYTRDGRFSMNAFGELVTVSGHRVLDEGGAPIVLPLEIAAVGVSSDGTLSGHDGRPLAILGLHQLAGRLGREADGLFAADSATPALQAEVVQGFLEASNVSPIRELTGLIEAQRAYERGRAALDTEHERLRRTIDKLGQQA